MASQWILYALLAAVFAGLVAIFGKIGLKNVDANLATTVRAFVMFAFLIVIILAQKKFSLITEFRTLDYIFITLAGIAGALSWLFYFRALQLGEASKVVPIDKLSLVLTIILAGLFLKEKITLQILFGSVLMTAGAVIIAFGK